MGLTARLERCLPAGDARVSLPAAVAIGVLVRTLCVEREPLYGLAEWAEAFEPGLMGLAPGEAALLDDDRVGRALDQLFDADRASLCREGGGGTLEPGEVETSRQVATRTSGCGSLVETGNP